MSNKSFAIKDTEKELQDLEARIAEEEAKLNPVEPEPEEQKLKPEEETFKKRYSDLRSFAAKKENELKEALAAKDRQIAELSGKQMKLPKTEEEVSAWAAKYPDVYDLVVTIAKTNAIEVTKGLDEKVKAQDERDLNYLRQKAYDELLDAHSDFEVLRDSEEFQSWLEAQPTYIYNALYENETDSKAAIRAIDLYKADTGISKKAKKPEENKEYAKSVTPSKSSDRPAGDTTLKWTESKVAQTPWREQERYIEEIEKAMENPAFYDLSGGAR
jgi:hypothetical protein